MFQNIEENYGVWSSSFARIAVDPSDPPSVEKFEKCLKRMGVEVALPLAKTVFLSDYRAILEKVVTPCTIIQCKIDFAVPNSVSTFMHTNIKGESTVEIINTRGHFPQLTAHEQFLNVIQRILTSQKYFLHACFSSSFVCLFVCLLVVKEKDELMLKNDHL